MSKTKKAFSVVLEVNAGETYTATGDTVNEALDGLGLDYTKIKTKGTFTLSSDGKSASKHLPVRLLRRVVVNKLRKAQVARDLEYLLK